MKILQVNIVMTFLVALTMALFYFFSHMLVVQLIGVLGVGMFVISLAFTSLSLGLNRKAFRDDELSALPMFKERNLLEYFRLHAGSAEDRFISTLTNYANLIFVLAVSIQFFWWICVSLAIYSFTSNHALRRSWPGYTLVLGASGEDETKRLAISVQKAVSPLFSTNLLSFMPHSELEHEVFSATSYRLKNKVVSWKAAVEVHSAFARIIVFDLSTVTQGVLDEVEIISESGFWYKTIFVCPSSESRSVLNALLIEQPDCLIVDNSSKVRSILESAIKLLPQSPANDLCIKEMVSTAELENAMPS